MQFDDIFQYTGKYGRYQKQLAHLICVAILVNTCSNIGTVFLNGSMDHYCNVPDNVGNCSATDYECGIEHLILPPDDDSTAFINETKCRIYVSDGEGGNETTLGRCDHGWTYDRSQYESTIVSEFDLVCEDSYKVSLAASSYLVGYFFGSIIFGTICDYFGRKRGIIVTLVLKLITGTLLSLSTSYWFYIVFRVLNGACTIGSFIAQFVYVTEIVGPSKRAMVSLISFLYFCSGFFLLAVLGYFLRSWRTFYLAVTLCPLPLMLAYLFIPESPRWLILHNRREEAKAILQKFARVNNKKLPDDVIDKIEVQKDMEGSSKKAAILNIFRYPNMRKKTLILLYCWFTVCLVYYGLLYGVEGLDVNIYVGVAISGVIQTVATLFACFSIQRFGRRLTLCMLLITSGVLCFVNVLIPTDMGRVRTGISMTGQFFVIAIFYVVFIYTSEMYSTDVRSFGVGFCSFMSRIAGILAPQILFLQKLWTPLPLVAFSVTSVSAGLLAFLLPETLNFPLSQTIEEAELVTRTTNRWEAIKDSVPESDEEDNAL